MSDLILSSGELLEMLTVGISHLCCRVDSLLNGNRTARNVWNYHSITAFACVNKVNASHTRYQVLGLELILVFCQSARRWLIHPAVGCYYFLPGLRLPSQPQSVTAPWPVPEYTAWWQRHVGVDSLPKVVMQLLPLVVFESTTCWLQIQRTTHCTLPPCLDVPPCMCIIIIRPHHLHTVHKVCSLLLQVSNIAWSVCLSVCWSHNMLCKNNWTDQDTT